MTYQNGDANVSLQPLVEETCPILKSEGSHRDVTIGQRENPASPNRSPVSQRRAENAAA